MLTLVGSNALKIRNEKVLSREPVDFDFICYKEDYEKFMANNAEDIRVSKIEEYPNKIIVHGDSICEFELISTGRSSEMFHEIVKSEKDTIDLDNFGLLPSLDMLYTLKSSHKYLKNSPHFWKTMLDYKRMQRVGAKIRPEYEDFLKLREKETYSYSHPKLNQSKKDFFSDANIQYEYDHDSIHMAVAIQNKPAYTFFKKDGAEVQTDKNKFFNCDRQIQLNSIMEESAVLAIERSLVPHPGVWTVDYAWKFALSKVCSSITSGWWREFAYENAFKCLSMYPQYDYWSKFQSGLKNGIVKKY